MNVAFSVVAQLRRALFRLAEDGIPAVRPDRTGRAGIADCRISDVMRRYGLVPLALWILAAGQSVAENKVLFIGNSFTYGEGSTTGVPDLFDRLARAGGQDDPVTLMQAIGGADFQQHAGNSVTLAAINSQAWTHVVLQGYSSEPTHLTPNNGRSIADHLTYGRALYNRVMQNNSSSKVVLYETWSRAASHPIITGTSTNTTFASTTQFQNELRTNYRLLRDNLNNEFPDAPSVSVAPVGSAWELAGALLPLSDPSFVDLFMANETPYYGYHANDRGTYLAACVFYAKLYGSSPVGLHMDPLISSLNLNFGSDPGMPAYLEATAWEMVANGTDPVTIIGQPASASVPEGHPVEFQAEVSGEPPFTIQWNKDGVPIAGATGMVLRIPAAWASLDGAEFTVDVSNAVSQVTSQPAALSVTTAAAYSVFVDFGGNTYQTTNGSSPNDPVRHWNNVLPAVGTTSNGKLAGLVTSQNAATLLDFEMLSRFNRENSEGETVTTVGLPPNATRDTLWGNTEVTNSLTDVFPRFRIDGLAPSWHHTLTFYASRSGVSDSRQTRYTVTGAGSASVDLEVANNTSNTAVLFNVVSAQDGNIEVALSPGPTNNSLGHYTYLGSLQIDAQPGPAPQRAALVGTTNGSGSIVASPAQADYAAGEFVELTAAPQPGWVFAGWSGDASGVANPVVVMIDADPAVTATFVPQNTAPTVGAITDQVINEDTSTDSIAFTIGDSETTLSLLVVHKYSSNPAVVAPSGLVLGGSGANRTINVTPLPNANGTATITIAVSDGELSTERSFLVTVLPVDDDQPLAVNDSYTIDEDAELEGDVSLNDTIGLDVGTLAVVTAPAVGDLTLAADGTFTYLPAENFHGVDGFVYRITDSDGDSSDATVTITVSQVNDPPVAVDAGFSVAENSLTGTMVGTVTASDPDAGQALAYAITTGNEDDKFAIDSATGQITVAGALDFETTPQYVLTVTVTDDAVPPLSDTATITIDLSDVNDDFADWLTKSSISNSSAGEDPDTDSITNAVEYVIGGDPVNRNDMDRLPFAHLEDPNGNTETPQYLLFSYRRTDRSNNDPLAMIGVDWSPNLADWNNAAVAPGVLTFVDDDHFGAGIDRVRVYLPLVLSPSGPLFARLAVFINDTP